MVERGGRLSLRRQSELLGLSRSSLYYTPRGASAEELALMRRLDELYLEHPFYGSRQMVRHLRREGTVVGRDRVRRLMRVMGLEALYCKPRTSVAHPQHRVYPYLLRGVKVERPDHVWCADLTYIPVSQGYLYLVAVMDWASRFVLSWRLSNTMDSRMCIEALEVMHALRKGQAGPFVLEGGIVGEAKLVERVRAAFGLGPCALTVAARGDHGSHGVATGPSG